MTGPRSGDFLGGEPPAVGLRTQHDGAGLAGAGAARCGMAPRCASPSWAWVAGAFLLSGCGYTFAVGGGGQAGCVSEVRVVDQTPAVGLGPAVSRALALSLAEQGWDCRPGRAGQPLEVVLAEVDGRWLGASDGAGIEAWGVRTRWRWGTGEGARHGETWVRGGSGQQLAGAPGVSSGTVGVGGADEGRHSLAGRAVAEALVTWLEWVGDGDR